MMQKKLPIGIQSFGRIRENPGEYVYVDKTKRIYDLISSGDCYFLSRPRRFGKSLTVSILESIFLGKKELFQDLAISKTDYAWPVHPVIRLDLSGKKDATVDELRFKLEHNIRKIADQQGIPLPSNLAPEYLFEKLVESLALQGRVVLLIDEYDKPITDQIDNPELANQMRDALASFYGTIKKVDQYLKFVFITGVSKFAKTSVFSTLNNLHDITMHKDHAALVGYTEQELITYFADYIGEMAKTLNKQDHEIVTQLREWYDGYCFSSNLLEKMYSPQTVMSALSGKEFKAFWFQTASPSFLMKLVKRYDYPLIEIENSRVSEYDLEPGDVQKLKIETILLQAGYLTIKSYDVETRNYTLGYPNLEVTEAFVQHVASEISHKSMAEFNDVIALLKRALLAGEVEKFLQIIYDFFTGIPYFLGTERHYQSTLYAIFKLVGADILVEDPTNIGRIDMTIQTTHYVYLFELKKNDTAQAALEQIIERKYPEKFATSGKKIVLIGLSFNTQERNLGSSEIRVL